MIIKRMPYNIRDKISDKVLNYLLFWYLNVILMFCIILSAGTLQCIVGKRGNPRLIVDGHTFFKKSTYKTKCFWYCKFNRNQFKCQATCWTRNGQIVKWPTGHTHGVIPELINPDEDTVVPIDRFREVLIQAALRKLS